MVLGRILYDLLDTYTKKVVFFYSTLYDLVSIYTKFQVITLYDLVPIYTKNHEK